MSAEVEVWLTGIVTLAEAVSEVCSAVVYRVEDSAMGPDTGSLWKLVW